MFIPWFFDVLGPTHHLITKLKNRYIFLSIFNLDFLLIQKTNSFVHNLFVYNVWHCHRQQKLTVNWPVTIAIYVSSDIFSFS